MVAFNPENIAYQELVVHPAPMAFLNAPIALLSWLPEKALLPIGEKFSLFVFWIENLVYVTLFMIYELLLIPLVYLKLIPLIPWATLGLFTSIFYAVFWFLGGLFISLFLAMRDVAYFLLILSMHNGCRENEPDDDEEDENADDTRERVMNEVRTEVIK